MSCGYNPDNSLASITYPSGRVVAQTYDGMGRLATIASGTTNYLSGLSYNAAGQATGSNYGNGVQAAFSYNDHLQLATLRYSKSGAPDLLGLKYDYVSATQAGNNGQIQAMHFCTTDPLVNCNEDLTKTENFSYDAWGRLSTAQTSDITSAGTWGLNEYYDRFGNRTEQDVSGNKGFRTAVSVDPATNHITGTGYSYDAAGNMTGDGKTATTDTYAYDAENRIVSVNGGVATYTYLGALRVKRVFGGTTIYVYSGTVPIAEYVAGAQLNQPNKEYIYSGSQLLATVDASLGTSYQMPDHLSTRVEADSSGAITRTFGHFPFGEVWYETGAASKWKFTSYERDSESALDYADFRFYSNRLGRFMQVDALPGSIDDPQSLNRYSYVGNDPCGFTDPLGLAACNFNILVKNDAGVDLSSIETEISKLFEASSQGQPNSVGVNFIASGKADYTLDFNNNGVPGQPGGYSHGSSGEVFANLIPASVYGGYTDRMLGVQGFHEMSHGLLGIGDLPYSRFGPNIMTIDSWPGWQDPSKNPMFSPNYPTGLLYNAKQLAKLFKKCMKKHPDGNLGGGGPVNDTVIPINFPGGGFWFISVGGDGAGDACLNGDCGPGSGWDPGAPWPTLKPR